MMARVEGLHRCRFSLFSDTVRGWTFTLIGAVLCRDESARTDAIRPPYGRLRDGSSQTGHFSFYRLILTAHRKELEPASGVALAPRGCGTATSGR